jgi:peptidoglycan hydrolase-like amidase
MMDVHFSLTRHRNPMRTRTSRVVGGLLAGVVVLAPSAPASAAASDPAVTVTAGRTLTVTGHGWGHGHGMSQWGAQGAALQGLGYDEIVKFYYPGTALSSFTGKVRVLITADTDNNTTVRATRGLRLTDVGRAKTWTLPTSKRPRAWRLRTVTHGTAVYYKTTTWHRYRPGGRAVLTGDGQFKSSTGLVTLRLPTGDRVYRGALRFSNRDTVNVLSMERYLRGVVPAEAITSWKPAALQAQAVAARTYAARERADHAKSYYHLCDTSHCQVYRGYAGEVASTNAAIDVTAGKILTYGGRPAFAQFSSSSGGWTSTGSEPYLVAQLDKYDTAAAGDPHLNWSKTVDVAALEQKYPLIGTLKKIQVMTRDGNATYPTSGWVKTVVLTGSTGLPVTITGSDFKSLYGLKSAYFSLAP